MTALASLPAYLDVREVAEPVARSFVLSSWITSYLSAPAMRHVPRGTYWHQQGLLAERLLAASRILIAFPRGEEVFLGYAIAGPAGDVLHYAFVKEAFRRQGIGTALLSALAPSFAYTHVTVDFLRHLARKFPRSSYNPFLLMGAK